MFKPTKPFIDFVSVGLPKPVYIYWPAAGFLRISQGAFLCPLLVRGGVACVRCYVFLLVFLLPVTLTETKTTVKLETKTVTVRPRNNVDSVTIIILIILIIALLQRDTPVILRSLRFTNHVIHL